MNARANDIFAFPRENTGNHGMTLRDYFAARALHAQIIYEGMEGCDKELIAAMAYEIADAMLVHRLK